MAQQAALKQDSRPIGREQILARLSTVSAIPTVSVGLLRLIQGPDAPNGQLARAIEYDPSLTSNLLRLANSAYFGYPGAVGTVRDAIFLLGRNEIFQLVVSSVVGKMTRQSVRRYGLSPNDLWDHLMAVAVVSRKLGEALHPKVPGYTFTAGLLHDIGQVVLGTFGEVDPAPIMEMVEQEEIDLAEAERRILGIDHAEVGALLLKSWNVPHYLAEVVRWHHDPMRDPGQDVVAGLVHVADALCVDAEIGMCAGEPMRRIARNVLSKAGLDAGISEAVTTDALEELKGLQDEFGG